MFGPRTRQFYIRWKSREWKTLKFSQFPSLVDSETPVENPSFSRHFVENRVVSPDITIGYDRFHRSDFGTTAWGGGLVGTSSTDRLKWTFLSLSIMAVAGCGDSSSVPPGGP